MSSAAAYKDVEVASIRRSRPAGSRAQRRRLRAVRPRNLRPKAASSGAQSSTRCRWDVYVLKPQTITPATARRTRNAKAAIRLATRALLRSQATSTSSTSYKGTARPPSRMSFVVRAAGQNRGMGQTGRARDWSSLQRWLLAVVVVAPAVLIADYFGLIWMIIAEVAVLATSRLVYEWWRRRKRSGVELAVTEPNHYPGRK